MTDNSKKVSELPLASNALATDRVLLLKDPSGSPSTRTITIANFANTVITSLPAASNTSFGVVKIGSGIDVSNGVISVNTNNIPVANSTVTGTVKVGNNLSMDANGFLSVNTVNLISPNSNVTFNSVTTSNITSGSYTWNYYANGEMDAPGNIIPKANNAYTLGNTSMRWQAVYVGGNSVVFADQNPTYPDQVLTVGNGVFYITNSGNTTQQSNAGFQVGNFLLQNNYIALTNSSAEFFIGTAPATGNLVINRPIVIYGTGTNTNPTFNIQKDGQVQIHTPSTILTTKSALSIIGSNSGISQPRNYTGTLLQATAQDGQPARISIDAFGANTYAAIAARGSRGTVQAPSQTQANDTIMRFSIQGWAGDSNSYIGTIGRINMMAAENFYTANTGTKITLQLTPTGSNTIQNETAAFYANGLNFTQNPLAGITYYDGSRQTTAFNSTSAVTKINVGTGLTQSGNVGIVGIDSTAVLSVAGTANQVSVSNVGGNYTLSLPQNIGTNSIVQFNTLTVQNLTVTGNSTIANSASVSNSVFHLAYDSSNAAQIDNGGFTLGNTASSYYVKILYNLASNYWDTGNTGIKTSLLTATNTNITNLVATGNAHFGSAYIGYDYPNAILQLDSNVNSYDQIVLQNHSSGTGASVDYVAVNDIGNDGSYFIDMGINSSTYNGSGVGWTVSGPNDAYLYNANGNLTVGTSTPNNFISFHTGGTAANNIRAVINDSGISVTGNVTANYFIGNVVGTSNNTLFIGSIPAANVVSNGQLIANLANYQLSAGLAANVITLTSNLANYIVANTGLVSNASGVFVNAAYITSLVVDDDSGYQSRAGLAANVATLTSNNTAYVGSVTAANVVSNAQLSSNLANYITVTNLTNILTTYQTTAGLSANVLNLTSNNTNYVGSVTAANVVSNAQLIANLANYVNTSQLSSNLTNYVNTSQLSSNLSNYSNNSQLSTNYVNTSQLSSNLSNYVTTTYLSSSLSSYQTTAGLSANVLNLTSNNTNYVGLVTAANVVSNAQLSANLANYVTVTNLTNNLANYQTSAGLSSNVATLTSNSANYIGSLPAANVVSNTQLQSNLANYVSSSQITNYQTTAGLAANVATLTSNNTNYVGSVTAANVVSNAQLVANLANYQTSAGLNANVSALGYMNTAASYVISGVQTHNANLVVNTSAGIIANGNVGTAGQFLTSNGSSVYWSNNIPQFLCYSIEADRTLLTSNSIQSMFGVGVTLASNTKYRYKIIATVYKANTSFSSTGALQFAITNATANAVISRNYFLASPCAANGSQSTLMNAFQMSQNITSSFNTPVTITNANTGATWYNVIIDGVLDITTGGVVNPQIAFTHTANLGSGTVLQNGATIEIWPIGNASSNAVIGTWV